METPELLKDFSFDFEPGSKLHERAQGEKEILNKSTRLYLVSLFAYMIDLSEEELGIIHARAVDTNTNELGITFLPNEDRISFLKRAASSMYLSLADRVRIVDLLKRILGVE